MPALATLPLETLVARADVVGHSCAEYWSTNRDHRYYLWVLFLGAYRQLV